MHVEGVFCHIILLLYLKLEMRLFTKKDKVDEELGTLKRILKSLNIYCGD